MRARSVPFILLITCILVMMGEAVMASKAAKIELRDGTVFEQVYYRVDKVYKVIVLKIGLTERSVSFPDIGRILDEQGRDVTEDCLGRAYRRSSESLNFVPGDSAGLPAEDDAGEAFLIDDLSTNPARPFKIGFGVGL